MQEAARLTLPDGNDIYLTETFKDIGRSDFEAILSPSSLSLISRQHLRISYENGKYLIIDSSSVNGTKLNDTDIKGNGHLELRNGDKIDIAGVAMLTFSFCKDKYQTENLSGVDDKTYGSTDTHKTFQNDMKQIMIPVKSFQKGKPEKKTVLSLLYGRKKGFILCEEGIYYMDLNSRFKWRSYQFCPWQSVTMHIIDEKHRIISIRCGEVYYKLQAGAGPTGKKDNFNKMKSILLDHIPESRRTLEAVRGGYRWRVLAISLAVLLAVQFTASLIFEKLSNGKVGDGLDDITGARIGNSSGFGDYKNGQLVHEYDIYIGTVYLAIHPLVTISSLVSLINEHGGIARTWKSVIVNVDDHNAFTMVMICCLVLAFWFFIILRIITLSAAPRKQWEKLW
jgi:pSer/pThr/pTyr-binding forkhead associated (FHA) protein